MTGLGAFYELEVHCVGEPDPATGYLMNIKSIDEAVRRHALPLIQSAFEDRRGESPARLLGQIISLLQEPLGRTVRRVRWWMTPYYGLSMSTSQPERVTLQQQFEFAASHRLHTSRLSDEENRQLYGKCNNPHGHGHNYHLQVAVSVPLDVADHGRFELATLERIVDQTVVQRFDHKHLNLDTDEFSKVNPSVEQMARVCHDLLQEPLATAGARIEHVTLWETQKTSCRYPAGAA
jgi:6-pyruvoyltetrahydropterin/6-carboxytetrahydropterin synthase